MGIAIGAHGGAGRRIAAGLAVGLGLGEALARNAPDA